jgi:integrase
MVQPIRDANIIKNIEDMLRPTDKKKYILFKSGIQFGLRISDIIKLKAKDLRNKDYIEITENKTGKKFRLKIQTEFKKELNEYLKDFNDEDYIIPSQKHRDILKVKENGVYVEKDNKSSNSPISRVQAYRILNKIYEEAGLVKRNKKNNKLISGDYGCHTTRKTFGYWFYQLNKDSNKFDPISILQIIFNHSTRQMTLKYIGILQDDIDDMIEGLDYSKLDNKMKNKKVS